MHKISDLKTLYKEKKLFFKKFNEDINTKEKVLIEEAEINFLIYVKRWKSIRLNLFINEIQNKLNSPEFSDPAERYKLL